MRYASSAFDRSNSSGLGPALNPAQEGMAMKNDFFDEIADTLFAIAVAAAIGLGAATLAIQVNKERAVLDASAAGEKLGQLSNPPSPDTRPDDRGGPLNF
jgi:hypothetical protein